MNLGNTTSVKIPLNGVQSPQPPSLTIPQWLARINDRYRQICGGGSSVPGIVAGGVIIRSQPVAWVDGISAFLVKNQTTAASWVQNGIQTLNYQLQYTPASNDLQRVARNRISYLREVLARLQQQTDDHLIRTGGRGTYVR